MADLTGNGKPDLIVPNFASNSVSVLLGNGNGTFQAQQTFATGTGPIAVAVADVNGDGKPDLIVANSGSNSVSVLLGNGNGTFQLQQTFATGLGPSNVTVADVNGDGKPDLIVTNQTSDSVSVLLGNGNGTFQAQKTFAVGVQPVVTAVADVNGDGKPDLVVANANFNNVTGSVSVLLGNGDGTFQTQQTFATGSHPSAVAVAGLNGDGKPDLVVNNQYDNSVGVLLGNGNGTFQPQQTFAVGTQPTFVAVADVNGDGKPDLVVANFGSGNVSVLLGNGNGTFQPQQTFATGSAPITVAVADLNGDGRPDLVTPNYGGTSVSVLLNMANGNFQGQVYTIDIPTVSVGGEAFVAEGSSLSRSGSFTDPNGSSWTATVDYGDGSGVMPLALNADKTFALSHPYTSQGPFTVTVVITNNLGGTGTGSFEVQVLPAPFQSVSFAEVQPGQTVTIAAASPTSSITFTMVRSAADQHAAEFLVATLLNVPLPALPAGTVMLGEYEARVIGAESSDEGFVTFRFPVPAFLTGTPVLQFLDGKTLLPVISSRRVGSLVFDSAAHTISVVFDITSLPTLMGLGDTVFTVSVNAISSQIPVNIQPAVALNAPTAAGLANATAFQSTSQLTFTLAPSQASQVSASQSVLSGATGGDNPTANPAAAAAEAAWTRFLVDAFRDDPEQLWWYGGDDALSLWLQQQGKPNAPVKPAPPKDQTPGPANPPTDPKQGAPDGTDPPDEKDPGDDEMLVQALPFLFGETVSAAWWYNLSGQESVL